MTAGAVLNSDFGNLQWTTGQAAGLPAYDETSRPLPHEYPLGLPRRTETPSRSPIPCRERIPKREEVKVHPNDEKAPETDDGNENGSTCTICMERKNKLAVIPCNHEFCYTCTQEMSGWGVADQFVNPFNCPFCRREVTGYTPKPDSDGPATEPADAVGPQT